MISALSPNRSFPSTLPIKLNIGESFHQLIGGLGNQVSFSFFFADIQQTYPGRRDIQAPAGINISQNGILVEFFLIAIGIEPNIQQKQGFFSRAAEPWQQYRDG